MDFGLQPTGPMVAFLTFVLVFVCGCSEKPPLPRVAEIRLELPAAIRNSPARTSALLGRLDRALVVFRVEGRPALEIQASVHTQQKVAVPDLSLESMSGDTKANVSATIWLRSEHGKARVTPTLRGEQTWAVSELLAAESEPLVLPVKLLEAPSNFDA